MSRVRIPFPAPGRKDTKKGRKALLAQSVERVLGKDEVSSSILEEGSSITVEEKSAPAVISVRTESHGRQQDDHHARVHDLQGAELQHHQEQEEDPGQALAFQVLSALPQARDTQGNEVVLYRNFEGQ
jgi:hypothetical protein